MTVIAFKTEFSQKLFPRVILITILRTRVLMHQKLLVHYRHWCWSGVRYRNSSVTQLLIRNNLR